MTEFGEDKRSKLSEPPSEPVEWCVCMPEVARVEELEERARSQLTGLAISRRIPRVVFVTARTWFEARRQAVLYWARKGVHFNPQSVREGHFV